MKKEVIQLFITVLLFSNSINAQTILNEKDYKKFIERDSVYFYNKAYEADDKKLYEDALMFLDTAIRIDSTIWEYHNARGIILRKLKRYDSAFISYQKALKFNPCNSCVLSNIGYLFENKQEYNIAIDYYNKAIIADTNKLQLYAYRASAFHKLKDYKKAIEDYDIALKDNPEDFDYLFGRGKSKMEAMDYYGAIKDFKSGINKYEENPYYTSLCYFYLDLHKESCKYYKKAIRKGYGTFEGELIDPELKKYCE
jgi:tetratricopeptide (TPR) repeat protein